MAHLVAEGSKISEEWDSEGGIRPEWLVLMVHEDNLRAIRFYEHCGFELIPGVTRRGDHRVMKLWIGD